MAGRPAVRRDRGLLRAGGLLTEFPLHVRHLPFEAALPHERRRQGLLVVCAAMFISAVDMTIVNVALPAISEDLNASVGELQWVLDAFLVALAGLLLVGSGLADRFGRKRVFLAGMAGFGIASVLCSVAPDPLALIAARALMGAAAACVLPPALSLIAVMFPPEERAQALGVWAAVAGVGLVTGPVLGGLLVDAVGWEAVFLVNVPVACFVVPIGLRVLPESTRPGTPPIDLPGAALSIVALAGVVFALIEAPASGWTSPLVLATGLVGIGAGLLFVRWELRRRFPLFDVRVLARPAVAGGAVAILSTYVAFLGTMFLLPQYLQYVHDRSVVVTGLLLTPIGIGAGAAARYNARVAAALGPRVTIAAGSLALAASMALFLLLSETTSVLVVMVGAGLIGALISITIPAATTVIMNDVGEDRAGDGGAVNQLARQVGGALGVAIVGTVFAAVYTNRVDERLTDVTGARRERAADSIEEARDVIDTVPAGLRDRVTDQIDQAFDVAARAGFATCVAILLVAAVVSAITLPSRPYAPS